MKMRLVDVKTNLKNHDYDINSYHLSKAESEVCISAIEYMIEKEKWKKMLKEKYLVDNQFHKYVDSYCKKHKVDVDEALRHKIVREYAGCCLPLIHQEIVVDADNKGKDKTEA